jgi:hypothetical protein
MFELHVVVAAVVMLNILELIMEIVPNYPTVYSLNNSRDCTFAVTMSTKQLVFKFGGGQLAECSDASGSAVGY